MENEPAGPGPTIVASQQHAQRKEETPGNVHESTVQMHVSVLLLLWTAQIRLIQSITTQHPHNVLECTTKKRERERSSTNNKYTLLPRANSKLMSIRVHLVL